MAHTPTRPMVAHSSRTLPPFHLYSISLFKFPKAGVHFELCYSAALRDGSARRNLVWNLQALLEALPRPPRGGGSGGGSGGGGRSGPHGLILSSGAEEPHLLRSQYDIINLLSLFGCHHEAARAALSHNPLSMLRRATLRKTPAPLALPTAQGIFDVLPVGGGAVGGGAAVRAQTDGESAQAESQKRKRGNENEQ